LHHTIYRTLGLAIWPRVMRGPVSDFIGWSVSITPKTVVNAGNCGTMLRRGKRAQRWMRSVGILSVLGLSSPVMVT
jgi:hypothetical protein